VVTPRSVKVLRYARDHDEACQLGRQQCALYQGKFPVYRPCMVRNDHVCRDWQARGIFRRAIRCDAILLGDSGLGVGDVLGFVEETRVNALVWRNFLTADM
jgi:hypothetical protein